MSKHRHRTTMMWIRYSTVKRIGVLLGLGVLLVTLVLYENPVSRTWNSWGLPLSGKVIVLDAGHGGPDGGAVSKGGSSKRILISPLLSIYVIIYSRRELW